MMSFFKIRSEHNLSKIEFPKADTTPIFICGIPRSGTTLCEQILSTHSNIHGAGDFVYDAIDKLTRHCSAK